jgi:hypothetical protein
MLHRCPIAVPGNAKIFNEINETMHLCPHLCPHTLPGFPAGWGGLSGGLVFGALEGPKRMSGLPLGT